MPRFLTTGGYVRRAQSLYDAGADGISLWGTYMRVPQKSVWSTIRRLGHKKDLHVAEPAVFHRLLKVGDKDVSRYIPAWGG
ncbi:MAG: hypothetical protein MJ099_03870, partial [Clostridia bacterium]|nr:hypothetical protein [Clostridia bacterium]